MAAETLGDVLRRIGRLAGLQGVLSLTDAQLLERFAASRDEPAFAALMVRHGPMVLGVCRRLLHDAAQAEDAFQAAFLVLARKASAIQRRPLLSARLYGVAYKVAARLRGRTWKRQSRETSGADLASVAASVDPEISDLRPLLHHEVQRLPDKYRNPIVLCYLEGKTHEEAALLLRWPLGTVKGRLARARDLLRSRLTQRGVTASEGGMATALTAKPTAAPARLMDATIRAATRFAAGEAAAGGLASARAVALTQGVLRTMMLAKLKIAAALALTLALLSGGGYTYLSQAAEPKEGPKPGQVASEKPALVDKEKDDKDKPKADEPAADKQAIQGVWQTTDVEDKGRAQTWDITAEKVIIRIPGQYDQLNGYTLDSSKTPKEIDLTLKPRKKSQAIYSLEGDVLKIYFAGSPGGRGRRNWRLAERARRYSARSSVRRPTLKIWFNSTIRETVPLELASGVRVASQ